MAQTFNTLHNVAKQQRKALDEGEPPDVQTGADAVIVAGILFNWIEEHASEAQKAELVSLLLGALGAVPSRV